MRLATSRFRGRKNLSVDVFALRTDDAASGQIDNAYGFLVDYPNDLWSANLGFKRIGDGFKPAMGFAPRTGIRKATLAIAFAPRPARFGIRQLAFEQESEVITNLDGRVDNWQVRLVPLSIRTDSGEEFGTAFSRRSNVSSSRSRSQTGSLFRQAPISGWNTRWRPPRRANVAGSWSSNTGGRTFTAEHCTRCRPS